ncbi:MAG: GNAT family N-acetyltransferase [Rikenellaceae bacterium]|nr:GNAT family N-acetyltransferase [Rikenellaceae bacterium]
MKHTRIKKTDHPLFAQAWRLYKKSFPPQERRQLRTQRKVMDNPRYHFDLITDEGLFVGFVLWWGFDDIRYIEHLATSPRLRGKGCGRRILERFVSGSDAPILLEVEHPTDEIGWRRIGFYRRAGFILNEYPYSHPPYKTGGEYVPLMLMTWPDALTKSNLKRFLEKHHPVIHESVLSDAGK